ncbi:sphingomyelin phosphodiesterase [Nesidiocoris tenuis]|uniref:Sphingomyelin phosphodiesterase n=1 Tax=Nesidiocoris tenuis TaxID=355587 RepID=A0ABN7A840_9HEMI|nr:sphingomyelin phosphodiesterase [Nesidiocoris tenuis]
MISKTVKFCFRDAVSDYLSPDDRMEALKNITDLLSRTFSSQFVFPVLGHADPQEPEKLGQLWRQWLPTDALQTFNTGGYYMIEQKSRRLKVIALNSNLWMEKYEDEIDPGGQWAWLDKHLDTAKRNGETVYLVGHNAPGFDERQGVPPRITLATRHNTRYHNMVRKYAGVVAGQFFGHLHSDSFRIIYDQQGSPVSTIFLTPAITPKRTSSGTNNPALRLYTFDTDNGQVLNYIQYFMNLTSSNSNGEAGWDEEYNFTRYYGIEEVTPYEMNELAQSFVTQEGIKLFGRYWMANSVHSNVNPLNTRTAWTNSHFCAITQLDSADYQDCLVTRASALAAANSQPTEPSSEAKPLIPSHHFAILLITGKSIVRFC